MFQKITAAEVSKIVGRPEVMYYVVNADSTITHYKWDGTQMVPALSASAVAEVSKISQVSGGAVALGLVGPVYVNRSDTDHYLINGVESTVSRATMSYHDLFAYPGSLRNSLTGKTNIEVINCGQLLAAIPGASSPPYWTDPGPVTLSRSTDNIPDPGVAPHLQFEGGEWVFRSLPGYGDAAAGHRRVQLAFDKIRARRRVVWDLSFRIHPDDDKPYDATYKYPFLLWQLKGANDPFAAMSVETQADGTYNLYWNQKWSSDASDVSTYRRQINNGNTGNTTAQSQSARFFQYTFKRGDYLDIVIESYLDERDITAAAGGLGYTNVWINGVQVLAYSGPTLSYRDTAGATPGAHVWYVGCYRHESGVPGGLKELDLNRQTDPAPFTRAVAFRRARMMDLGQLY
jgi:hypothetical protein